MTNKYEHKEYSIGVAVNDDPAILRCAECGVSWMHGDAPKHVMTCSERYRGVELTEETLEDALDEIRRFADAAGMKITI